METHFLQQLKLPLASERQRKDNLEQGLAMFSSGRQGWSSLGLRHKDTISLLPSCGMVGRALPQLATARSKGYMGQGQPASRRLPSSHVEVKVITGA